MKICYLIQTYKNPEQIYRLIHTIKTSSPNSIIILSHNSAYSTLDTSVLEKYSGVHLLSAKTGRGDFSLLREYLSAIGWAFNNNIDFDWLINLTGQDYPIQPLSSIELVLSQTPYDAFIEYYKVFSPESNWSIRQGRDRYLYKYQKPLPDLPKWFVLLFKSMKFINILQPLLRIHSGYALRLGVKVKSPFNDKFICYGGSYFCILSKKCIKYLYEFYQQETEVINHYKHVINPEESFIHTVLANSKLFNLCNESKHYYNFYQSRKGVPAILTKNDYLLIKQVKYYFARKFDQEVDNTILDILDQTLLAKR